MSRILLTTLTVAIVVVIGVKATPLDDYVNTPDSHYKYNLLSTIKGVGYTLHVLNMTSQKWLDESVVRNPIWWHYVTIVIPDKILYTDTSYVWIGEGSNTDKVPGLTDEFSDLMAIVGVSTGTVCAVIKQVPNQPTVFVADPSQKRRKEDAIIAWTWKTFLHNTTDPRILLRMPMTKAVVRAMDTVTDYSKNITGHTVNKFVVGGASKRGWTTWTTTAVDKRVIGMTPCVMDLLHFHKNLHHHYRSLGGWTFAFNDYYDLGITTDLDNPNMPKMQAIIDPISYNDRYKLPKLILSTSGDEFFLPDDSHYYYNELNGPKYLRIVPNAEHSMIGHVISVMFAIRSFYQNLLDNKPYPTVTWERSQTDSGGKIVLYTSEEPTNVIVYHARTLDDKRRDFRLVAKDPNTGKAIPHPVLWFKGGAKKISNTQYEAEIEKPLKGWAAFFIEVTFEGAKNFTLEFTTEMCIVPDVFPFPDCTGEGCRGELV